MKKYMNIGIAALVLMASPAYAADCGEPPIDMPVLPAGSTASAEDIRNARDAVLSYSATVDKYIACMDARGLKVAAFMTKEQKARRQDDLTDLHNERRDLQLALNEAIRDYRRQRQSR